MNNLQSNQDGRKPIVADATPCEIEAITIEESRRLVELETTIGAGLQTFVEVGEALLEIRDSRLYRIEHRTFEAYCREKWGMSRPRVYQLIGASQVAKQVSTIVDKAPSTESQARPLTKLPPEKQAEAWTKAQGKADGKQPTASQVEAVVVEMLPPAEKAKKERKPRITLFHKVSLNPCTGEIISIEKSDKSFTPTMTLCVTGDSTPLWDTKAVRQKSFGAKVCKAIRDHERKAAALSETVEQFHVERKCSTEPEDL